MPLSDVQIREAFHVLVLRHLLPLLSPAPTAAVRIKGGVNLRLFYDSERYSEDMDLDADARLRAALKRHLRAVLQGPALRRDLLAVGIRDLELPTAPAKDTDTVLRFKLRVVSGGVPYPTKIEISYRGDTPVAWAGVSAPDPAVGRAYLPPAALIPAVGYYGRTGATWQKLYALAGRTEVQARDVFDLRVLLDAACDARHGPIDRDLLRRNLPDAMLSEAKARALDLTTEAFREQVATYLEPPLDMRYTAEWPEMQLLVAEYIDELGRLAVPPNVTPALPTPNPAGSAAVARPRSHPPAGPGGRRRR